MSLASQKQANNVSSHKPNKLQWDVKASSGALNTSNPIREIIETMDLAENPNKKVIPLSIGDPTIFGNLKPSKEIIEALERANTCGKYYGYQTAAGTDSAREAVAEYHFRCTGNRVKKQDVILASGCSHAIDLSICVLAGYGQNILIPRPGFPLYKTLTSVYGVQFKQYDLIAEKNWSIDLNHLESLIDENTAAIVINNPSNPCGSVFSRDHLLEILEVAERHKKPIISDEIYDKFVFSNDNLDRHYSIQIKSKRLYSAKTRTQKHLASKSSQVPNSSSNSSLISSSSEDDEDDKCDLENLKPDQQVKEQKGCYKTDNLSEDNIELKKEDGQFQLEVDRNFIETNDEMSFEPFISIASLSKTVPILTCGGISKTCLIPGLRLGWIIIHDRQDIFENSVRGALSRLTQRLMGPNSLVQGALSDILMNVPETFYMITMDFILKNAKLCYQRLKLVKGLQPHMPQGSMYQMVRFDARLFPDINGDLDFTSKLMNEESVLVLPGKCFDFPHYFRICLTVPTNVMEEALDRIKEFCERHYLSTCKNSTIVNHKSANQSAYTTGTNTLSSSFKDSEMDSNKYKIAPIINQHKSEPPSNPT